jgi:hypothetical protein
VSIPKGSRVINIPEGDQNQKDRLLMYMPAEHV